MMNTFIATGDSVTIAADGDIKTVGNDHPNFDRIKEALRSQDFETAVDLTDLEETIRKYSYGLITVEDGVVSFGAEQLGGPIVDQILRMIEEEFDLKPVHAFLENLFDNPSYRVVQQFYGFLENNRMPWTEDGCFLAYKIVNGDFTDCHTSSYDNSPGRIVSEPRHKVDEDPDRTCSRGLHVCSKSYLPYFGGSGSRVVLVKVNPKDVVAIPRDYNNAKMRCCRYEVLQEVDRKIAGDRFEETAPALYRANLSEANLQGRHVDDPRSSRAASRNSSH